MDQQLPPPNELKEEETEDPALSTTTVTSPPPSEQLPVSDSKLETILRKEGWYLGELGEDACSIVLQTSGKYNVFAVHKTATDQYILSVRFAIEGTDEGNVEHLKIKLMDDGKSAQIESQSTVHNSIIDAVNTYTASNDPPLTAALLGNKQSFQTQLSMVTPPAYSAANKQLQPDIATLPNIDNVDANSAIEAAPGKISPTGSLEYDYDVDSDVDSDDDSDDSDDDVYVSHYRQRNPAPQYMNNPHYWRYRDKPCCHPKNTCHYCFHRETFWDGYREVNTQRALYCKGTGFCRCILLVIMWSVCWPFLGFYICCEMCWELRGLCYEDD